MRDYGRVHSAIWSSPDFLSFSDDAKIIALYLLTSPHTTMTGAFRLPNGYVCADLGWELERVKEGLQELFRKGFCNRCETTKWVWICKFLRWNPPENPNQWKAVQKQAAQIPKQCAWVADFIEVLRKSFAESRPDDANPFETLSKPGTGTGTGTGTGAGTGAKPPAPSDESLAADGEGEPPFITLPLVDKSEYPIFQQQVDAWSESFPGIDVGIELRKLREWNVANAKNRKTKAGVLRHVTAWLSRAQDRSRPTGNQSADEAREIARRRIFGEDCIPGEARRIP